MMQRRITRAAGPAKAAAGLPAVRSFFAFRLPAGAGGRGLFAFYGQRRPLLTRSANAENS